MADLRYLVLVPDGAADYALDELDGCTPLQAAKTPNMDRLALQGQGGMVQMIPPSRHPGSDVGNLEIFGYDSTVHYTGRAPLEAASMGLEMGPDDIAFRCNLVYNEGDTLVDYSAGHIETEEGRVLVGRPRHLDARCAPGVEGPAVCRVVAGGAPGLNERVHGERERDQAQEGPEERPARHPALPLGARAG